jgi:serine-type D-Ala-D-Ala carboxypeptidase (penicillin-binding protein 5/6)
MVTIGCRYFSPLKLLGSGLLLCLFSGEATATLPLPTAPTLNAASAILVDYPSGQVLAEQQADSQHYPASLVKIMVSYAMGQALKAGIIHLSDQVFISQQASDRVKFADSSKMFLKLGQHVPVADLQKGIIIQSGNDACVAMAEHMAGSESALVTLMNHYAQALELTNTHFVNVHGLDHPDQYSSARDMARLASVLIRDLPEEYQHYRQKTFTYNGITQPNRNALLWDSSLQTDGVKTGGTTQAGFNLVASATEGDRRLIAVVLGASTAASRAAEGKKWLQWGFRFFERHLIAAADEVITQRRVWFGADPEVTLGLIEPLSLTLPRGRRQAVTTHYQLEGVLKAPLQHKQIVGNVRFELDGKVLTERPLQVLKPVNRGSLLSRFRDTLVLWWRDQ